MNLHIPDVRILEIHLTPWNNLRSICQPSSVREERNDLGLPHLRHAISDAANLGYNFLHVAGPNPLGHPGLPSLCREAHQHGMLTSIVTRRAALSAAQLAWLKFSIDLLGVEVEGRVARGRRPHALRTAAQSVGQRLRVVRQSGIPFAVVFPLTSARFSELEWAADFAAAQGALMLNVRPSPDFTEEQLTTAWMMVQSLRETPRAKLAIHFESVNPFSVKTEAQDLPEWKENIKREERRLGELVSPLVIEEDGTAVPLCEGFARRFILGNVEKEGLARMVNRWIVSRSAQFGDLYGAALDAARSADRMFGDLHQMVSKAAQSVEQERSRPATV